MPSRIEIMGFGFTAICLSLAVINLVRALTANSTFLTYLKQNHYPEWMKFIGENNMEVMRHICLTPLNSENLYHYFVFRSDEEFGDTRVMNYKRQIRSAAYGFIFNAVAS